MAIYLKLMGPNNRGLNPKGCYTKGWTDPFYEGCDLEVADMLWGGQPTWVGMRLDDYIVVDCDNYDAMVAWLKHTGLPDLHTWTRKTPNGWHFIYKRTVDTYGVKAKVPWFIPNVDLKVGPGHLIVFRAPGYEDLNLTDPIPFDLAWLPAVRENDRSVQEWSDLPDGQGDSFMISMAGKLRSWGADGGTILDCLEGINAMTMRRDPMPHKSLVRIAKSATKYEPDERTTIECLACGAEMEIR